MLSRSSYVKQVKAISIIFSSTLSVGDANYLDSSSKILAVHQEKNVFEPQEEIDFYQLNVFSHKSPCPVIFEDINMTTFNKNSAIRVDLIDVLAASTASVIQIGNVNHVRAASRVENIRRLQNGDKYNSPETKGG